jgi:hypothetical protein
VSSFSLDWTVEQAAQEIERVARLGLGDSAFEEFRARFIVELKQMTTDLERQSRIVGIMLAKLTNERRGMPGDNFDIKLGGMCIIWFAGTSKRDWAVRRLYKWASRVEAPLWN